ncbi:TraR/DksA C4-type zinc finger protein [Clostridium sp.]|uniref:TraR/DksA C4-type zinc finger protein n=1 Tax=Clostridium sp. TaxID=1506 RepID=UPI0026223F0B|nr:TraR/DksA C4-type zinc finger protein [Clostridium sp.]
MNKEELSFYKDKLKEEKRKVNGVINQLNNNGMTRYNSEVSSELSFYDNHPADIATEVSQVSVGRALEANEVSLLDKIDGALRSIDEGSYGTCKNCGKNIDEERLKFLPYAENCIDCQDVVSEIKTFNSNKRVVEESVLGKPFGNGFNHHNKDELGFDAEDSYQAVEIFNKLKNIEEYYYEDDDYVEEIEKVSNQEYKNQLP